jgi:hypothetical protein
MTVGMFYRKSVLVIDGKNNNDDGKQEKHKLRRRSEQYAEIKAQKRWRVETQIKSRPLMHNRQINDRDELQREKRRIKLLSSYNPAIGLDRQIS